MDFHLMFAYGSNMNLIDLENYCISKKLTSYSINKISNAELTEYCLTWSKYSQNRNCGVLNIEPSEGQSVWGVLYKIDTAMLNILDKKEGFPKSYFRKKVTVITNNGDKVEAETYIALPSTKTFNFWPNCAYYDIIIKACVNNNIPQEYIYNIENNTPFCYIQNTKQAKNNIAIYSGQGVNGKTLKTWCNLFTEYDIGSLTILYSHQFTFENLEKFDLIILPGGGGTKICNGLGDLGKENLREYIDKGGKLLGVCAGAYAISSGKKQYMSVCPIGIVDIKHSNRGSATLKLFFTELGQKYFILNGNKNSIPIIYHNGPVIYQSQVSNTSNFEVLAIFEQEITHENGTKNDMINTASIWTNNFGKGFVYGISPHIERTPNYEFLMAEFINKILI